MIKQRTLKNVIRATGVGLHTGEKVYMTLRPAAVNTGIVFRRTDLPTPIDIPSRCEFVGDTRLSSTLVRVRGRRWPSEGRPARPRLRIDLLESTHARHAIVRA